MKTRPLWRRWWVWALLIASAPAAISVVLIARMTVGEPADTRVTEWLRAETRAKYGPSIREDLLPLAERGGDLLDVFAENVSPGMDSLTEHRALMDAGVAANMVDGLRPIPRPWFDKWFEAAEGGCAWVDAAPGENPFTESFDYLKLRKAARALCGFAIADMSAGKTDRALRNIADATAMGRPFRSSALIEYYISLSLRGAVTSAYRTFLDFQMDAETARRVAESARDVAAEPVKLSRETVLAESLVGRDTMTLMFTEASGPVFGRVAERTFIVRSAVEGVFSSADQLEEYAGWQYIERSLELEGDWLNVENLILPWTRILVASKALRRIARDNPDLMASSPVPAEVLDNASPEHRIFNSFPLMGRGAYSRSLTRGRVSATHDALASAAWAARVHKLEHGDWPSSVDELDPELWAGLPEGWDKPTPAGDYVFHHLDDQSPYGPVLLGEAPTDTRRFVNHIKDQLNLTWTLKAGAEQVPPVTPGHVRWKLTMDGNAFDEGQRQLMALMADALPKRMGHQRCTARLTLGRDLPRDITPGELMDGRWQDPPPEPGSGRIDLVLELEYPPTVPAVWVPRDAAGKAYGDDGPNFGHQGGRYSADRPAFIAFPGGLFGRDI